MITKNRIAITDLKISYLLISLIEDYSIEELHLNNTLPFFPAFIMPIIQVPII